KINKWKKVLATVLKFIQEHKALSLIAAFLFFLPEILLGSFIVYAFLVSVSGNDWLGLLE
ncbi:MAG: hypothetical protein MKZ73_01225, partial [Alphaproteobacteria bacterium]|nr:hypothetical protein [Alphaproteobacteria bacterium]